MSQISTFSTIIIIFFFFCLLQYSVLDWVKDHRVHHKYTDTDADPYSSDRGFFYSHLGWIMMKVHPECTKRLKEVNADDVLADPVVVFGEK